MGDLRVVPVTVAEARAFVRRHHRHHDVPPPVQRFAVGVALGRTLVGVAIVGNPASRVLQAEGNTLEVRRSATDGTHNANSMLYGAAWRVARELGWSRLITYTEEGESGSSLRAAGYRVIGERPARGGWDVPSRPRSVRKCPSCGAALDASGVARTLWEAAS